MGQIQGQKIERVEVPYFEGANTLVGANISKIQELSHIENARSLVIGTIEKRQGTTVTGTAIVATANYGLTYFENTTSTNNGIYRISTASGVTSIYYLNSSNVWTALTGSGTKIYELGDSTTQFDITLTGGTTYKYTYDTTGTDPDIDAHIRVGTIVVINAQNFSAGNKGTFTVTGVSTNYFEVTNTSGVVESNKTIGTGSITVTGNKFSYTFAEGNCFLVNGDNDNMYIQSNGTTVVTSTSTTGHLYNSPKARKINYYKDKLYLGDFTVGSNRYKNSILMSSPLVGIVALAENDYAVGVSTIEVSETKYIHASDSLDVYRGNTKITTLSVNGKTEESITLSAVTTVAIQAADELWVANTFPGPGIYRWVDNPSSGINCKEYDTFKLTGNQNDAITLFTNIGSIMVIGNKNNLAYWDNYNLQNLDLGVGCVSERGFIKTMGTLFFTHYTGIYSMSDGARQPKLISAKVNDYITGASKSGLEASSMGRKKTSIFSSIGDVTLYHPDGSVNKTLSNVVLELDLRQENWYIHTNIKVTEFTTYPESTDSDRLEMTTTDTNYPVMEFLSGETDDGSAIPMRIDSDTITLSKEFEKICYPEEIIVESERGSGIKCFVSLDGDDFYEIEGESEKGCTILKVNNRDEERSEPPRCRRIKLSFRHFDKQLCKISRVAIKYKMSLEEESIKPDKHG